MEIGQILLLIIIDCRFHLGSTIEIDVTKVHIAINSGLLVNGFDRSPEKGTTDPFGP